MILGRIICMFKGHKRGKRVADHDTKADFGRITTHFAYQCPRCGRETRYKVKPSPAPPTPPAAWTGGV